MAWRKVLKNWKMNDGKKESSIPKTKFPMLLKELLDKIGAYSEKNIRSGFKACGINPLDKDRVLHKFPKEHVTAEDGNNASLVSQTFIDLLKDKRGDSIPKQRQRRKKINVTPGKSVGAAELENYEEGMPSSSGVTSNQPRKSGRNSVSSSDEESEEILLSSSSGGEQVSAEDGDSDDDCKDCSDDDVALRLRKEAYWKEQIISNVFVVKQDELVVGDWLAVSFPTEGKKNKEIVYFGKVQKLKPLIAKFLRYKPTKSLNGHCFIEPTIPDITEFGFKQIIGKLVAPAERRGTYTFRVNIFDFP